MVILQVSASWIGIIFSRGIVPDHILICCHYIIFLSWSKQIERKSPPTYSDRRSHLPLFWPAQGSGKAKACIYNDHNTTIWRIDIIYILVLKFVENGVVLFGRYFFLLSLDCQQEYIRGRRKGSLKLIL